MPNPCRHANITRYGESDYIQVGCYTHDTACDDCGAATRRIVCYPGHHLHTRSSTRRAKRNWRLTWLRKATYKRCCGTPQQAVRQ